MIKSNLLQLTFSFLLGGIGVFSYSPFNFSVIAFISFTGLLLLISEKNIKQAALIGLFWGLGYFLSGVHWIYISIKQYGELPTFVALLILVLLILYLSLYPLLFSIIVRLLKKIAPAHTFKQWAIVAPLVWQCTEFVRGHLFNGFAWLQFGYSQLNSPLKGLFPLIGINGINLVFCFLCGLIAYTIYHLFVMVKQKQLTLPKMHLCSAIIALLCIYLAPLLIKNIDWTSPDNSRKTTISLVQGNISQSLRWNRAQLINTLSTYYSLTKPLLTSSDIIIWPEATITDLETNQQQYLQHLDQLATENNSAIAVGIIDLRSEENVNHIYNSLIVLGDEKPYFYPTTNRYTKHHLVPFGEFIPLQSLFQPLAKLLDIPMSMMSAGSEIQPTLIMKGFHFTTIICYEVILSDLVLKNFNENTDFLLTVSNDAWFGDSIGPWQHLQMAQARALEFGRTLIRSTNNGISVIIDPKGNITHQLPQFNAMSLTENLSPNIGLTPYAKWGNRPTIFLFILLIICLFIKKPRR